MYLLDSMRITAKRDEVLAALKKNRAEHTQIVKEAREGYVAKAKVALEKKLAALSAGKLVALSFTLVVPVDQTKVYDTAIAMIELHQGDTVELDSGQVRSLMLDQWDWSNQFYGSNAVYSSSAQKKLAPAEDDEEYAGSSV